MHNWIKWEETSKDCQKHSDCQNQAGLIVDIWGCTQMLEGHTQFVLHLGLEESNLRAFKKRDCLIKRWNRQQRLRHKMEEWTWKSQEVLTAGESSTSLWVRGDNNLHQGSGHGNRVAEATQRNNAKDKKAGISLVDWRRWRKKRRLSVLNNQGTQVSRQEQNKWKTTGWVSLDSDIRAYWDILKRILAFNREGKIAARKR